MCTCTRERKREYVCVYACILLHVSTVVFVCAHAWAILPVLTSQVELVDRLDAVLYDLVEGRRRVLSVGAEHRELDEVAHIEEADVGRRLLLVNRWRGSCCRRGSAQRKRIWKN